MQIRSGTEIIEHPSPGQRVVVAGFGEQAQWLRNGDAHLKNFGIVYDDVLGAAHLAPVYDLVTTSVYLPGDRMALTLNGTNQWPSADDLARFGEGRALGSRRALTQIFERISDVLSATCADVSAYGAEHPEFAPVGRQMLEQWELGRKHSLAVSR